MKKAFTLIELLIVLIIIGIIATLAVPQFQLMKERAIAAEAINILGSEKRKFQTELYAYGDYSGSSSLPRRWTQDWYYYGIVQQDPSEEGGGWTFIMAAQRREGPYKFTNIRIIWESTTNTTVWAGNHPCVPKNLN